MKKTKAMRATRTPKVTRTDNPTASKAGRRPKPTTAYELLQRVCDHIKEEPKRYFQGWWVARGKRDIARSIPNLHAFPPCGTVGCRAGWIVMLHDGVRQAKLGHFCGLIQPRANEILGMFPWATSALFHGGAVSGEVGTALYAKRGIQGIRKFMKLHEVHLKARLLKDVPHV